MKRQRFVGVVAGLAATAGVVLGGASTAVAKGGEVGGTGDQYFLSNTLAATSDTHLAYGRTSDQVYIGDWDGDGQDTLAVRRGSTFHLTNSLNGGNADRAFTYGRSGDVVLVGDWDGDGTDTFAVRRGNEYHVRNSLSGGNADRAFRYGRTADVVLVGDWDGDGADTFAVRRDDEYHVRNTLSGGNADVAVTYGRPADVVLVGDWDGDRDDTFAVRRGVTYYVANEIRGGEADQVVTYGRVEDTALVGDWDGDGRDTFGVRRGVVDAAVQYDVEMVQIINRYRAAEGVPPMEHWGRLRQGAVDHSRRMLAGDFFEHATHDIISADTAAAGCRGGYGENIFWSDGYPADPEIAMQQYMDSPGHRANILHPNLRYVATGTVQIGRELYNTQRFAVECG